MRITFGIWGMLVCMAVFFTGSINALALNDSIINGEIITIGILDTSPLERDFFISIEPINPYDPIAASIPEPVFNMNDIEPKPDPQEYETAATDLDDIINKVDDYYSGEYFSKNASDNPHRNDIPLISVGRRYGLQVPVIDTMITQASGWIQLRAAAYTAFGYSGRPRLPL